MVAGCHKLELIVNELLRSLKNTLALNSINHEGLKARLIVLYPMDFKMDRGGKGANPREHR